MYTEYWGLDESPFSGLLDTKYYYPSTSHEEAMARMQFLVEHQRRLGIMCGAAGSGKTLLFGRFADQLRRAGQNAVVVSLLGMTSDEFLWQLADELGESIEPDTGIHGYWRVITDRLLVNRYQQVHSVLLLDDADEAESEVLATITRLTQWQPAADARLTLVVACNAHRPELVGPRLLELCDLRIDVKPWMQEETADYLESLLLRAGREQPMFDASSVAKIHQIAGGIPRHVRRIAELAMIAGAGKSLDSIDENTILAVHSELSVSGTSPVTVS